LQHRANPQAFYPERVDEIAKQPTRSRIIERIQMKPTKQDNYGTGVGVGLTEADGNGEGDSPGVEKFGLSALLLGNGLGVGTGMNWG
jgi:hypothetical protein